MDWETVKAKAREAYEKFALFYLFQSLVLYVVACIVAGHPVSLAGYVEFLGHLFRWKG